MTSMLGPRWMGDLVSPLRTAVAIVAVPWTVAAIALSHLGRLMGPEVRDAVVACVVWALLLGVAPWLARPRHPWLTRVVGVALAGAFFVAYGAYAAASRHAIYVPEADQWLDCPAPPPPNTVNEYGLRGAPGRNRPSGVPVVAIVGCSVTFGFGLADADAPAVRLEGLLRDQHGLATRVFDFSCVGATPTTLVGLIRYARRSVSPTLLVVYYPRHHVTDRFDRQITFRLLRDSVLFRAFVATHLEPLFVLYGIRNNLFEDLPDDQWLSHDLTSYREAAGDTRLLLVTDMVDRARSGPSAATSALEGRLAAWRASNPDVQVFDASRIEAWQDAESQPDGHWSASGVRTAMRVLADHLAPMLQAGATDAAPPDSEAP